MPHPIFSHLMGTLALLGAAFMIIATFVYIGQQAVMTSAQVQLREVVEAVGRDLVELFSVHTLGGSNASCMEVSLPQTVAGRPYLVRITGVNATAVRILGRLQDVTYVRIITLPNFGEAAIRVAAGGHVVCGADPLTATPLRLVVSDEIRLPLPQGSKVFIVARKTGSVVEVGFGVSG